MTMNIFNALTYIPRIRNSSIFQIPTEQTSQLGAKANYMKKLLDIVKSKMNMQAVDITMKFTLSALWNLTGSINQFILCFVTELANG